LFVFSQTTIDLFVRRKKREKIKGKKRKLKREGKKEEEKHILIKQ